MSNNDLIRRVDAERARDELVRVLNYINTSGTLDYADYCELFDTIEREFDALKVVPREMTAREYGETLMKICATHTGQCWKCELGKNKPCAIPFKRTIPIVEAWAREHHAATDINVGDKDNDVLNKEGS